MKQSTKVDYRARIDDVIAYLEAHQDEDVTPARLAEVAAFSIHHFHRVFRGVSGESVMQCIRRLRLETAARRLRDSEVSVTEVAFTAGFASHEGFTRAFSDHFGEPPATWRKSARATLGERVKRVEIRIPEVSVRTLAPTRFVFVRHHGAFADVGEVWARFVALASSTMGFTGDEQLLGRYPDDPEITSVDKVRFDVGFVRPTELGSLADGLREETLEGGLFAVAEHRGSYATLHETYLALVGGFFPSTGRELGEGPCLEFYLNSPRDTPEAELRTEVWAPIEG